MKKYWRSRANLTVRKSGNHDMINVLFSILGIVYPKEIACKTNKRNTFEKPSTFKTPAKQACTSFRTPVKSSEIFVTPRKRESTSCHQDEHHSKKPRLEDNIKGSKWQ